MTTFDISDFVADQGPSNFARWTQPGDYYLGKVVSYSLDTGGKDFHGNECGHLDLEQQDGEIVQITIDGKRSLRNAITKREPKVGDLFGIRYLGKRKSNKSEYSWMAFEPLRPKDEVVQRTQELPDGIVVDDDSTTLEAQSLIEEAF